jgi:hypothetical protein
MGYVGRQRPECVDHHFMANHQLQTRFDKFRAFMTKWSQIKGFRLTEAKKQSIAASFGAKQSQEHYTSGPSDYPPQRRPSLDKGSMASGSGSFGRSSNTGQGRSNLPWSLNCKSTSATNNLVIALRVLVDWPVAARVRQPEGFAYRESVCPGSVRSGGAGTKEL